MYALCYFFGIIRYDEDVQELCFLALECFETLECNEAVDAYWQEWELANADPAVLFERKTRADWMKSRDTFAEILPETVDERLLIRARFLVSDQNKRNKKRFFDAQAAAIKLQATIGRGAITRIAMDDRRDLLFATENARPSRREILHNALQDRRDESLQRDSATKMQSHIRMGLAKRHVHWLRQAREKKASGQQSQGAAHLQSTRATTLLDRLLGKA